MTSANRWRVAFASVLTSCLALGTSSAQYEPSLQYQSRGDRHEGLRMIAVGGYDIELLSARVDSPGPRSGPPRSRAWADSVHLRFYLPENLKVFVTIRQLRSGSTYYWLDQVQGTWKPRSVNDYSWPTGPVLRQLTNVRLDDLGAIVRTGQDGPAKREIVLPAVLFDADPLDRAEAYRFALKTNGRAKVSAAIYANDAEVYRRPSNWEQAGSPFTILWNCGTATEGWYRLVLSGYFEDNTKLDKEVVFYHRPRLADRPPGSQRR